MSAYVVVLDACVLFPASLRDTLLRAAHAGLYKMKLTDDILEEVRRNLVQKSMPEVKAERLITVIREQFPEAFVTQHNLLVSSMTNDEKDRHILAAAVVSKAQFIVTRNLKDFPLPCLSPFDIEAQSPDDFLLRLFNDDCESIAEILLEQARELRNPPKTVLEILDTLMQHAPKFVGLVHKTFRFDTDGEFFLRSFEEHISSGQ